MKRSLIAIALLTFTLFAAACGTTTGTAATTTPSLQGVVTSVSGNTVTVTPNGGGTPVTLNMNADTRVAFTNGIEAGRAGLTAGYKVDVWTAEGSQNATRIIIR